MGDSKAPNFILHVTPPGGPVQTFTLDKTPDPDKAALRVLETGLAKWNARKNSGIAANWKGSGVFSIVSSSTLIKPLNLVNPASKVCMASYLPFGGSSEWL
jgi:hypothetical protein